MSTPAEAGAAPKVDPTVPTQVEDELAKAHDAIAAADADAADRALARAEAILRAHPESPAAPWLRAETWRAWSRRFLRLEPRDEARAAAAWQEAEALDGGRVAGIGERSVAPPPKVALTIVGAADATIDGKPPGDVLPGEHVVVAPTEGYAEWIAVRAPMTLVVPRRGNECSTQAFRDVKRTGDSVTATGVGCPEWIAAAPAEHGVLVARCAGEACTALVEWRRGEATMLAPPQARDRSRTPWPAWATWTMVGVGAAAIGTVALIAAGVLESRPVESRFVLGGTRTE